LGVKALLEDLGDLVAILSDAGSSPRQPDPRVSQQAQQLRAKMVALVARAASPPIREKSSGARGRHPASPRKRKSLTPDQPARLAAFHGWLAGRLARLVAYAYIGWALAGPAVRPRVELWAEVLAMAHAAPHRSKHRWIKRRKRGAGDAARLGRVAEGGVMTLTEQHLREAAEEDLPWLDWDQVLTDDVNDLIDQLAAQNIAPAFVSRLLRELQRQPGQWPEFPSPAAVKKRIQRLRPSQ
jgi:hypothetical protein